MEEVTHPEILGGGGDSLGLGSPGGRIGGFAGSGRALASAQRTELWPQSCKRVAGLALEGGGDPHRPSGYRSSLLPALRIHAAWDPSLASPLRYFASPQAWEALGGSLVNVLGSGMCYSVGHLTLLLTGESCVQFCKPKLLDLENGIKIAQNPRVGGRSKIMKVKLSAEPRWV